MLAPWKCCMHRFVYPFHARWPRSQTSIYRLMVEYSRNALALHKPDGIYLYVNAAYTRLTGYTRAEMRAVTHEHLLDMVHPDDRDMTQRSHHAILDDTHSTTSEYRLRRKDGSFVWVETVATRILNARGQTRYLLASTRDTSQLKEAQYQAFQAALQHERVQMLSRFVRNATHEFRTPLAIINTEAYLMARQPNPDKRDLKAQQISQQVTQLSRLVDMLLLMVRLEDDDRSSFKRLHLASVVQQAYERVRLQYPGRPAELHIDQNLPAIRGYAEDLEEAFAQIIDNAYRYSPPESPVRIHLLEEGSSLCLQVQDEGLGISLEDQARIFEMFWRKDESRNSQGFGLGLAVASRVVDRHGGVIRVRSTIGQGSTLCIVLPSADEA